MALIRCPACGWENEPEARICGGCGRPLGAGTNAMGAAGGNPGGRNAGGTRNYGSADATGPDAPTVEDFPAFSQRGTGRNTPNFQQGYRPANPRGGPQPAPRWSSGPEYRGRSEGGKIALGVLLVLVALVLASVGVWAAIVRPQVHQQVDAALRSQLSSMVATVNDMPAIPTSTVSVTADQASAQLQAALPSDVPLQNVHVTFDSGRAVVSYTAYGMSGAVATSLSVSNGRLVATDTTVSGPIGMVESSDDLQAVVSDALAKLRHDVKVKQVTAENDVLTLDVNGNV